MSLVENDVTGYSKRYAIISTSLDRMSVKLQSIHEWMKTSSESQ